MIGARTMNHTKRHRLRALPAALAIALLATGCSAQPAAETSPPDETTNIRIALDWSPNTNHTGIFVAQAEGYFADAGLDVEIINYGGVGVPDMIRNGDAEFGVADQTAVQMKRSQGYPVRAVLAITQTETGRIIALPGREDIQRPRDLDGKIFGGFDSPVYANIAESVIKGDGGEGLFDEITMNTSTYDALADGSIDFTLSIATWEDVLAELEGREYTTFAYQDFGVPDMQTLGLVASDAYLELEPAQSRALVQAVQRGYQFAVEHPDKAAEILIAADAEQLTSLSELVHASSDLMAREYYVADGRGVGELSPEIWQEYGAYLFEHALIADAEGVLVEKEPDWSEYFTNEYLALP